MINSKINKKQMLKIIDNADKLKQMMQSRQKTGYVNAKRTYKTGEI